jgi:hypothetical protein
MIRRLRRLFSRSEHYDRARGIPQATAVFIGHRSDLTPDRNLRNPPPQKPTARQVLCNLRINSDFIRVYLRPVRHRFARTVLSASADSFAVRPLFASIGVHSW